MAWYDGIVQSLAGAITKTFGDQLVLPVVQQYLKNRNIETTNQDITQLSTAIVDANVKLAEIQENYVTSLMHWWLFRWLLGALLVFPVIHFCMAIADNSVVYFFDLPYGTFNVPALKGTFADIEHQLLLTFVIVHGGGGIVSALMSKLRTK